jgi:hypothetical protein
LTATFTGQKKTGAHPAAKTKILPLLSLSAAVMVNVLKIKIVARPFLMLSFTDTH